MPSTYKNTYRGVTAKTASYQVKEADVDELFTTEGASGAVTFTLPVTTDLPAGWGCGFFQAADQNMVIASYGSSDDIVTANDLAADSITFSTAGELIGNHVEVIWSGTKWLASLMFNEAVTPTIA